MTIGILKEPAEERRVSLLPEIAGQLVKMNFEVCVESDAGATAYASDDDYKNAGAKICSRDEVLNADLLIGINKPSDTEIEKIKSGAALLCAYQPLFKKDVVLKLLEHGITSFSMDMVPRTTRAQSMDILSSQATVAGYKAVLLGATHLPKFFPMFMTAAGTITPA